ncbi:MAG TPA: hypothetical protein DCZ55_11850 [Cyanobacteria bacterium UBA11371]|nr:hypothetical protein [Cyanobacteria bacterium UBA11371]HBE31134.1 hypothetical protein [Cyanobacteria bacterium UBA11368]
MKYATVFATLGLLSSVQIVLATPSIEQIPRSQLTGRNARLPTLYLWPGHGVSISFYETDELIKRVWLDDISRIVFDVDGCLENSSARNCTNPGAGLIHLRQIEPLRIPGALRATNGAHLTLVTQNKAGQRQTYHFRIIPTRGTPQYSAVQIVPDAATANDPNEGIVVAIARGMQIALTNQWIRPQDPLWNRLQNLLAALRNDTPLDVAATQSGVSIVLVNRLVTLGQGGFQ